MTLDTQQSVLTEAEVTEEAKIIKPDITPEEIGLILKYSLGIRLLVTRITELYEINEEDVQILLGCYILHNYAFTNNPLHDNQRALEKARFGIAEMTDKEIPKEVVEYIRRHLYEGYMGVEKYSAPGGMLEAFPFPRSEITQEAYQGLLRISSDKDRVVRIFLPNTPPETLNMLRREEGGVIKGRLSAFGVTDLRSACIFTATHGIGSRVREEAMAKKLPTWEKMAADAGTPSKEYTAFHVDTGWRRIQSLIGFGYAIETLLQGCNLPYLVYHSWQGKQVLQYSPNTQGFRDVTPSR